MLLLFAISYTVCNGYYHHRDDNALLLRMEKYFEEEYDDHGDEYYGDDAYDLFMLNKVDPLPPEDRAKLIPLNGVKVETSGANLQMNVYKMNGVKVTKKSVNLNPQAPEVINSGKKIKATPYTPFAEYVGDIAIYQTLKVVLPKIYKPYLNNFWSSLDFEHSSQNYNYYFNYWRSYIDKDSHYDTINTVPYKKTKRGPIIRPKYLTDDNFRSIAAIILMDILMFNDDRLFIDPNFLGLRNYRGNLLLLSKSDDPTKKLIVPFDNVFGFRFIEREGWNVQTVKNIED